MPIFEYEIAIRLLVKTNKMKAINFKNETFKVTGEKGDFIICLDSKDKVRMFAKKDVEVIEIEDMVIVAKSEKSKKLNPANFMSSEEFSKSKYANMSKSDYEDMRRRDAMNSKSF